MVRGSSAKGNCTSSNLVPASKISRGATAARLVLIQEIVVQTHAGKRILIYLHMEGILHINNFITEPSTVFNYLKDNVEWDERMTARKTASFGVAYNYSQMSYPYQPMPGALKVICSEINNVIGFEPNNCLLNYYLDGKSKMGFHADQTDFLEANTGIVIVSLGETRILRFRNFEDKSKTLEYELLSGSLIYMPQAIQQDWEHAIPKSDTNKTRMSLTLRKIV